MILLKRYFILVLVSFYGLALDVSAAGHGEVVQRILQELDSPNARVRKKALAELNALDKSYVDVLERKLESSLSAEQRMHVEAYLINKGRISEEQKQIAEKIIENGNANDFINFLSAFREGFMALDPKKFNGDRGDCYLTIKRTGNSDSYIQLILKNNSGFPVWFTKDAVTLSLSVETVIPNVFLGKKTDNHQRRTILIEDAAKKEANKPRFVIIGGGVSSINNKAKGYILKQPELKLRLDSPYVWERYCDLESVIASYDLSKPVPTYFQVPNLPGTYSIKVRLEEYNDSLDVIDIKDLKVAELKTAKVQNDQVLDFEFNAFEVYDYYHSKQSKILQNIRRNSTLNIKTVVPEDVTANSTMDVKVNLIMSSPINMRSPYGNGICYPKYANGEFLTAFWKHENGELITQRLDKRDLVELDLKKDFERYADDQKGVPDKIVCSEMVSIPSPQVKGKYKFLLFYGDFNIGKSMSQVVVHKGARYAGVGFLYENKSKLYYPHGTLMSQISEIEVK